MDQLEVGNDPDKAHDLSALMSSLDRYSRARKRVDRLMGATVLALLAVSGGAYFLSGYRMTEIVWAMLAMATICILLALLRLTFHFLFWRRVLSEPWAD